MADQKKGRMVPPFHHQRSCPQLPSLNFPSEGKALSGPLSPRWACCDGVAAWDAKWVGHRRSQQWQAPPPCPSQAFCASLSAVCGVPCPMLPPLPWRAIPGPTHFPTGLWHFKLDAHCALFPLVLWADARSSGSLFFFISTARCMSSSVVQWVQWGVIIAGV